MTTTRSEREKIFVTIDKRKKIAYANSACVTIVRAADRCQGKLQGCRELADGADSLDTVELVMALEKEFGGGLVLPATFAGRTDKATFREWVEYVASARRAA